MTASEQDQQAIAATRRWIDTAVIGLNLCPFARAVVVADRVRYRVSHARDAQAWHPNPARRGLRSFHPGYQFAGTQPDDIENCTNRSPFPVLHLLREASIERAVANYADPASIYERNIETMRRLGTEGWQRLRVRFADDSLR